MITAFLGADKCVNAKFDFPKSSLRLYVDDAAKARALATMLHGRFEIGKLHLDVMVYTPNHKKASVIPEFASAADVVKTALKGNPFFKTVVVNEDPGAGLCGAYCVFAKKVLQYANDNLADLHGLTSTLAEVVAREIFAIRGVLYSTSNK